MASVWPIFMQWIECYKPLMIFALFNAIGYNKSNHSRVPTVLWIDLKQAAPLRMDTRPKRAFEITEAIATEMQEWNASLVDRNYTRFHVGHKTHYNAWKDMSAQQRQQGFGITSLVVVEFHYHNVSF